MKNYPIIKITLFFIIGILSQKLLPLKFEVLFLIILLSFSVVILFPFVYKAKGSITPAIPIIICYLAAGALTYSIYISGLKPYPFEKLKYSGCSAYGTVRSIELMKEGRVIFNAGIDSVNILSKSYKLQHEFIVRLYEEDRIKLKRIYEELQIGSKFSLKGTIQQARDKRNPGEFDYNDYLYYNGISGLISVYDTQSFAVTGIETGSFAARINNQFHSMRKGIDNEIQKYHSKQVSGLLRGLLLGDYKKIDEESLENYINAGVIHVLAVSGQHVALILLIFVFLFNRFNPYLKYIFAITGLVLFFFITGNQISVARAVIMGLFFIAATLLNREKNVYNILSLSALVILAFNPNDLFNPGFQLSYSAVISIVYIYPIIKEWLDSFAIKPKILKNIILFGAVSLSAQIGTLPFTLAYFHKLSIAALLANLIIIPLSGMIIYVGIVTLVLSSLWGWGAAIFAASGSLLSLCVSFFVELFGKNSFSFLQINQFSFYDAFIYYTGLFVIIYIAKNFRKLSAKYFAVTCLIAAMFLFMSLDNYTIVRKGNLTVLGVDIGQGDATLFKFPDGKTGLIDAGNAYKNFSNGDKVILPLMNRIDISFIDYAFITHVDADHYYGIYELIEKGKIGSVFKPETDSTNKADINFEKYLRKNGCLVHHFKNEAMSIGACRLYFFNNPALTEGIKLTTNSRSMIMKLVYGNTSFLFTGDADKEVESKLAALAGVFLKSDVLKAGHHGSKNSSADLFVEIVKPKIVLISAGIENRFGHPAPEVVRKFEKIGASVLRTDKKGALLLNSDGYKIYNIDWKKRETHFIFDL